MDRSANPWRVLDDTGPGAAGQAPTVTGGAPGSVPSAAGESGGASLLHPTGRLIGGLLAAIALATAAFGLAASGSNGGGVTVDNGGAILHGSARPSNDSAPGTSAAPGGDLVVDIQGAVLRPGIRHLPTGSRVADAVAAAGGYGPRVDAARAGRELNLAAQLHDGDRVVIPSRDDPPATAAGGAGSPKPGGTGGGGPVDLNHATASELDTLPGVGPVTAQKIIIAREEQAFATIEELRDRKIVGAAAFEKLKDLVTVTP
jgi:competence protein ComEA